MPRDGGRLFEVVRRAPGNAVAAKFVDNGYVREALLAPPPDPTDKPKWTPTTRRGKVGKWLMDNYIYPMLFVAACVVAISKWYEYHYPKDEGDLDLTGIAGNPYRTMSSFDHDQLAARMAQSGEPGAANGFEGDAERQV
jgi:hypothetical protein